MIRYLLFCIILVSGAVQAETVQIAARWQGSPLDYTAGTHPFSWVIRSTVLPGIAERRTTFAPGGSNYSLRLVDAMKMEADFATWYFRLSPATRFSSGARLTVDDISYSLNKCQERGLLTEIEAVVRSSTNNLDLSEWVRITITNHNQNNGLDPNFPARLAVCPIFQSDLSNLFGKENARGTVVVGAGEYAVTEFDLRRKQIELSRIYRSSARLQSLEKIILRGVVSERDGLTALRVGTVDMLVFKEAEVKQLVLTDESLRLSECDEYLIAYRKALKFSCASTIDFDTLVYER